MHVRLLRHFCVFLLLMIPAFAQQSDAAHDSKSSLSVNLTGVLNNTSTGNGLDQTATQSAGFLASYRVSLSKHNAFEFSYGYTRNSQTWNVDSVCCRAKEGLHEITGAYVFKMPAGKITPFLLAGGGALIFNPIDDAGNVSGASTQARPAFLYGGGLDYSLVKNLSLRLQYRGQVYKAPDFGLSDVSTDSLMHSAEPSVGLVFNF